MGPTFPCYSLSEEEKDFLLRRRLHNFVFKPAIVLVFFVEMNKTWRFELFLPLATLEWMYLEPISANTDNTDKEIFLGCFQ